MCLYAHDNAHARVNTYCRQRPTAHKNDTATTSITTDTTHLSTGLSVLKNKIIQCFIILLLAYLWCSHIGITQVLHYDYQVSRSFIHLQK